MIYSKTQKGFEYKDFISLNSKIKENRDLLLQFNCDKVLADYSESGLKIERNTLFYVCSNFNQIMNLPHRVKFALFYGDNNYTNEWELYNLYIEEFNIVNVKGFSNMEEAFDWLELDKQYIDLLSK